MTLEHINNEEALEKRGYLLNNYKTTGPAIMYIKTATFSSKRRKCTEGLVCKKKACIKKNKIFYGA